MDIQNQRHLEAAQGWLGLGNWNEANDELENITPQMRAHPDVLDVRWEIYALAKKWNMALETASALVKLAPERLEGWTHRSFSLHKLKRTREAFICLFPAAAKFPSEYVIRYNLACYACQLGRRKEAMHWLAKAIDLESNGEVRLMALEDRDLEPLWADISEI